MSFMTSFEQAAGRTTLRPSKPLPRPLPSLPALLATRLTGPNPSTQVIKAISSASPACSTAAASSEVEKRESWHSDCSTAAPSEVDADDAAQRVSPHCSARFKLKNKKFAKLSPAALERELEAVKAEQLQTIPAFRAPPGLPAPPPGLSFLEGECMNIPHTLSFATPPIAESAVESDDNADAASDLSSPGIANYSPGDLLQREAALAYPLAHLQQDQCVVLNLDDAVKCSRGVGNYGYPSAGSAGHYLGLCKPCDFVHRGNCRLGVECQYCHLCPREEAQLRKKDKKRSIKALRKLDARAGSVRQ